MIFPIKQNKLTFFNFLIFLKFLKSRKIILVVHSSIYIINETDHIYIDIYVYDFIIFA